MLSARLRSAVAAYFCATAMPLRTSAKRGSIASELANAMRSASAMHIGLAGTRTREGHLLSSPWLSAM